MVIQAVSKLEGRMLRNLDHLKGAKLEALHAEEEMREISSMIRSQASCRKQPTGLPNQSAQNAKFQAFLDS